MTSILVQLGKLARERQTTLYLVAARDNEGDGGENWNSETDNKK